MVDGTEYGRITRDIAEKFGSFLADSAFAEFLNRASKVFGLTRTLGWEFQQDFQSQGPVIMSGYESPRKKYREKINEFIAAVLDLRNEIANPPDGTAEVVAQLRNAGKYAKILRDSSDDVLLELWPYLNQVAFDGYSAVKAARSAGRLDDPFAFLDDAPAAETEAPITSAVPLESTGTAGEPEANAAPQLKRRASPGSAQEKIRAALLAHHQYQNGSVGNRNPIGTNQLARLADVSASSVTAFWEKQFGDSIEYERQCANGNLGKALEILAGEVTPRILSGEYRDG